MEEEGNRFRFGAEFEMAVRPKAYILGTLEEKFDFVPLTA